MQFHLHPWLWTLAILYFTFLYNTHSIKCYCSYLIKSISRFTLFFAFYYFSHFWASTGDFCSAYLSVVKNSLSFGLKISFVLSSFLKDIFIGHRILRWQLLYFNTLKMLSVWFWLSVFRWEVSFQSCCCSFEDNYFFFRLFLRFSFCFVFQHFYFDFPTCGFVSSYPAWGS